jgi:ribonuclease E
MLINATQQEELRMAMVDGQRLYDLNIEAPASERKKANIYLGKITRIEPSLEAAFVDYGSERHGFLPLKEVSSEYFSGASGSGKPNIKDVLKEGQSIVVQVDKEERGNKGAALTTFVSLAGRFIVLKPNKARSGGVSRRITGEDRDAARSSLNSIEIPDGMSVILRTAGIDRSAEELAYDLENLLTVWTAILNVVLERPAPFLIYRESDSVVRALRDYMTNEIGEVLIDDEQTYKDAVEHVSVTMPQNLKKLKLYADPVPLFTRFQIESQIESAFAHSVSLPSGGSIVIDHTEALVSIDINSARATKGGDIEATALNTNLEAADEIARQLRIRDLGGLIVIDFIDMGPSKHQRAVENRLREAVRQDRARVQIGKISRFGLLEMSRQRLRPSIGESAHMTCPRCSGFGNIRSVESLALAILRIVGEEARKERTPKVIAQLPVEVSTFLLNEKRDWVQSLEDSNDTQIVLVANPLLETPHYEVRRVRDDQTELPENAGASYELAEIGKEPETPQAILERKQIEVPAVGTLQPTKPAPQRKEAESKGLFATIAAWFSGDEDDAKKKKTQQKRRGKSASSSRSSRPSKRRGDDKRGAQTTRKKTQKKTTKKAAKKTTKKADTRRKTQAKDAKAQDTQANARDESRDEQKRPSRSRRSRGGRRRRRGTERPDQAAQQQAADSQPNETRKDAAPKADSQPSPQRDKPEQPKARQADKPKAEKAKAEPPKTEKPKAEKPRAAQPNAEKPKSEKTEAKPAEQPKAEKPKADDAAPKKARRPRAETAPADKPKVDTAPTEKPQADKPKSDSKPAGGNGADAPAERKLLPWEPQQLPVAAKPEAKEPKPQAAEQPRSAPKPEPKPETQPPAAKEPKPAPKPADSGQD